MAVDFKLYLITDRSKAGGEEDFFKKITSAITSGVRAVQLREKDLPVGELMRYAYTLIGITKRFGAHCFINDRIDVALAVGADGVHLGRSGMPPEAARKIVDDGFMIGVSTHSLDEALSAQRGGADFITFGPVYETPSKVKYGKPLGIAALKHVVENVDIPVFGIGGINEKNMKTVLKTGVRGVAMISAILGAADVEKKTEEITGSL